MSDLTALHEASHAIIAIALDLDVEVSMSPPRCKMGWPEQPTREAHIEKLKACATAGLAGPAIEQSAGGSADGDACLNDWAQAYDIVCKIAELRDGVVNRPQVQAMLARLYREAERLVKKHIAEIHEMAGERAKRGAA